MRMKKGFTLIELLVVISIIAFLSTTVYSSLNVARSKARDATRILNIEQIANALNLYAADHNGSLPSGAFFSTQINTGNPNDWSPSSESSPPSLGYLLSPYIKSLPVDQSTSYACLGYDIHGNCYGWWTARLVYYFYTNSFLSLAHTGGHADDSVAAGTCYHKALIMVNSSETQLSKRQDCKFQDNVSTGNMFKSWYPNAVIILLNQ